MSSKITLPADTPFVECYQSLNSEWRSCTHLGRLATKREGEFIRTPDDPQFAASFSSPTTKDCIGPGVDVVSSCDIQIKFTNEQVLKLQEENVIPSASTLPPLAWRCYWTLPPQCDLGQRRSSPGPASSPGSSCRPGRR